MTERMEKINRLIEELRLEAPAVKLDWSDGREDEIIQGRTAELLHDVMGHGAEITDLDIELRNKLAGVIREYYDYPRHITLTWLGACMAPKVSDFGIIED